MSTTAAGKRLEIDPNMKRGGYTSARNDLGLGLARGDIITVFEPEDNWRAVAMVVDFWGLENKYVLLDVRWQDQEPDI